ncbi:unnamed protein product, partial [Polarella glacialis]
MVRGSMLRGSDEADNCEASELKEADPEGEADGQTKPEENQMDDDEQEWQHYEYCDILEADEAAVEEVGTLEGELALDVAELAEQGLEAGEGAEQVEFMDLDEDEEEEEEEAEVDLAVDAAQMTQPDDAASSQNVEAAGAATPAQQPEVAQVNAAWEHAAEPEMQWAGVAAEAAEKYPELDEEDEEEDEEEEEENQFEADEVEEAGDAMEFAAAVKDGQAPLAAKVEPDEVADMEIDDLDELDFGTALAAAFGLCSTSSSLPTTTTTATTTRSAGLEASPASRKRVRQEEDVLEEKMHYESQNVKEEQENEKEEWKEEAKEKVQKEEQKSPEEQQDKVKQEKREEDAMLSASHSLLAKLRRLDPGTIRAKHYALNQAAASAEPCNPEPPEAAEQVSGPLDVEALTEDLELTRRRYCSEALEAALQPLREEMRGLAASQAPTGRRLVEVVPAGLWQVSSTSPGASPSSAGHLSGSGERAELRLLLSDATSARDLPTLRRLGVTRVVNCSPQTVRDTGRAFYGPGMEYMELWQDDFPDYCVLHDFDAVWAFVTSGGTCLIHCEQGVNRSCTLAMAVRMRLLQLRGEPSVKSWRGPRSREQWEEVSREDADLSLKEAWRYVILRKPRVLTNPSFQRQLLLFARTGFRWFPSLAGVWRTPGERRMAHFRMLAEHVAKSQVCGNPEMPWGQWWRAIVYIRDGTMRGEHSLAVA